LNSNLPDFSRNFVLTAVFNFQETMKNEPQGLRELLSRLPDAPVSSNFTARVMRAVEMEGARRPRRWNFLAWNWHALLPRATVAAVMMAAIGFTFYQHEIDNRRFELAQNVALVAQSQPLPSVDVLQNFDAIQRMSQPARADEELLALASDLK
jgi:hypothetical protein